MLSEFPLLILRSDVVFPKTFKDIEVGRDFSINAVNWSRDDYEGEIVVACQKEKNKDSPTAEDLLEVGCLCKLKIIGEKKDRKGELEVLIKLEGIRRVQLVGTELLPENNVWKTSITYVKTSVQNKAKCKTSLLNFLEANSAIFSSDKVPKDLINLLDLVKNSETDLEVIVDRIADMLSTQAQLKKDILCEKSLLKRIGYLSKLVIVPDDIKNFIEEKLTRKVTKNISRQQREFYLREKLKVIRDELGESSSKEAEIKRIKTLAKNKKMPDYVRNKVNDELHRLELCSSYSSESTVIRAYLDWIVSLPWEDVSEDEKDLTKVQKSLDEGHFGLEKIKERILEYIAVRSKTQNEKGTIMCFVGPPGVGKSSLAKSIARALNKEFVKISLGGLYDEAEIRGHRRTYVASLPGRIIRALKQAKVKNPVFLLDEIDKVSTGYHGDPIHSLLEILDPKQNDKFNDHYIEEDFDLSKVMFIATANYEENIPDPLLDRMEVIYLRTYTDNEKLNIAKSHLIPEVLKESGLTSDDLKFTEEALLFIIHYYTREAGVRNLKQNLEKISRKFVKKQLLKEIENQIITPKEVKEYLEYELYDYTKKDEISMPGVVNGMAYTDFGGDLLPIEVNHMSGKGNLSLTGNLKDTMRESANVALAYVRANEEQFGLKDKSVDWANIDINLHVPSGGIPKDGPSAGVTITTALISSFSGKPVSSKIAMTGEITLRGKVLPIGGIKEKVVSAVRGGVDTIFYPYENTKNLADVPEDIKEKISLIPVKHYQDIYDRIFIK